eukprot:scaffold32506_cov61-Phaeocystis_antarctica.AAC.4
MSWSRFSTDESERARNRPGMRFSREEYTLMSTQLDLPEWLGVPLRQIPPEYECKHANFESAVRERPGLRGLSAQEFWVQAVHDIERMPKCRKYLAERRRRPALAVARARLETRLLPAWEPKSSLDRAFRDYISDRRRAEDLALLAESVAFLFGPPPPGQQVRGEDDETMKTEADAPSLDAR